MKKFTPNQKVWVSYSNEDESYSGYGVFKEYAMNEEFCRVEFKNQEKWLKTSFVSEINERI